MPDTTFLHIRRRDSSPTKVLELAEPRVRVGRGPECEVRLGGESLADVHCLLSRNGDDWEVEPSAEVLIDGRPVDSARPLAPGEVLKVGDHWLSIETGTKMPAGRGSFDSPIVVASVEVEASRPEDSPTAADRGDFNAADERMARWQASQQQRDRWLKDRQQERGWEARWRAAGDALRARSSTASPSPRPAAPYRRAEPSPASQSRPAVRPSATGPAPVSKPSPAFRPKPIDDAPATIPFPSPIAPSLKVVEVEEPTKVEIETVEMPATAEVPESAPEARSDPGSEQFAELLARLEAPIEPEPESVESAEIVPIPEEMAPEPSRGEYVPEPTPIPEPRSRPDEAGWPTVQSILAARNVRPPSRPKASDYAPKPSKLTIRAADGGPTEGRPPRQWNVPSWLALPISVLTCLTFGGGGSALAWTWAADAQTAGPIADRVLKAGNLPSSGELPEVSSATGSWWGSSAGNLYLRAIAADRSETDPEREERARFFLKAARQASPLRPDVRLALARLPRRETDPKPALDSGLSRDVVSLAWTGHEWLASGRFDEAKSAFAASLDLAARAEPPEVAPAVDEEQDGRRFRIAGEEALESVLADMADGQDWSFSQWSAALPQTALVQLAAYRVLKSRESPDAARVLEVAASPAEPSTAYPKALHLAARAEALAIQGRWAEAEPIYREAIAAQKSGVIRRSWWANLADLDGRLGEESRRRDAWDAAVAGASAGDEIGRQVARARGRAGLGAKGETAGSKVSPERNDSPRR